VRELKLKMREWNAFWAPFLYVGTLALVFGLGYQQGARYDSPPWQLGDSLFHALAGLDVVLIGLVVPVFAGGALSLEREQRTLSSLLLTRLTPRQIVYGKFGAILAYTLMLLATSLPLVLMTEALGGSSASELILHYLSLMSYAALLGGAGLLCSAHFKRSVFSIAVCFGLLALLVCGAVAVAEILRQTEATLGVRLLRPVAFLSPLYYLDQHTMWQWPLNLAAFVAGGCLLAEAAVARLGQERVR
jgi:ABC-type transport system involved in multi-copper enzyme maturation permease subunit